jgi:hypothetical protein
MPTSFLNQLLGPARRAPEILQVKPNDADLLPQGSPARADRAEGWLFSVLANPTECGNESFRKWNGSETIPVPAANCYCYDLWTWQADGPSGPRNHFEPGTSSIPRR